MSLSVLRWYVSKKNPVSMSVKVSFSFCFQVEKYAVAENSVKLDDTQPSVWPAQVTQMCKSYVLTRLHMDPGCFIGVMCGLYFITGHEGQLHFRVWGRRSASKNKSHYLPVHGGPAGIWENPQCQRLQIRGGCHRPAPHSPTVRNNWGHFRILLSHLYYIMYDITL